MKDTEFNYEENLIYAKEKTVYAHAMVWIKDALENKKSERDQFEEIKRIVDATSKQLGY